MNASHVTYDPTAPGNDYEGSCEVCGKITPTMHRIEDGFTPTMILCDDCYDEDEDVE